MTEVAIGGKVSGFLLGLVVPLAASVSLWATTDEDNGAWLPAVTALALLFVFVGASMFRTRLWPYGRALLWGVAIAVTAQALFVALLAVTLSS